MASLKGDSSRVIYKINEENFNIWKVKLETGLVFVDLWNVKDKFEVASYFNDDFKVEKRKEKKKPKTCQEDKVHHYT